MKEQRSPEATADWDVGSTLRSSSGRDYFARVAALGAQAADALAYAHRKGVLHRDIKPSNLLMDLTGNVWITDFGLAKVEGEHDITATGDVVGTLRYIAPESLSGQFDSRGDIYGLGLTLYELVARRRAFAGMDRGELVRQISDEGPPRLSRQSGVPRDLETIIFKAIERDSKHRYHSARELADDLQRFLRYEPVQARRISAPARLLRWARRNPALATVSGVLLSSLIVALVVSLFVSNYLFNLTGRLTTALDDSRQVNYVGDIGLAYEAIKSGDLTRARRLLSQHIPTSDSQAEDLRGFEWRYLWSRTQGNFDLDLGSYHGFLVGVAISPDGEFLARLRKEPSQVEIVRISSGEVVRKLEAPSGRVATLMYSPSGTLLIGDTYANAIVAWNTNTWQHRIKEGADSPMAVGRRDNQEIIVARKGEHFVIWNATDWSEPTQLFNRSGTERLLRTGYGSPDHMGTCLAISGDGKFLFLASADGIQRWNLDTKEELEPFAVTRRWYPVGESPGPSGGQGMSCIATSSDGRLAVGDRRGSVWLVNPSSGEVLHEFEAHVGWVSALKFSADGTRLVSAGGDRNVVLYDPAERIVTSRLSGHSTQVWGLDISANGDVVAAGSGYKSGRLLTWAVTKPNPNAIEFARVMEYVTIENDELVFVRPGKRDADRYHPARATYQPMGVSRLLSQLFQSGAKPIGVSPNREWVVALAGDGAGGKMTLWNIKTQELFRDLTNVDSFDRSGAWRNVASFSPDSKFLVTSAPNATVRLWRTADWTSVELCPPDSRAWSAKFSRDSRRVAVAERADHIRIFDLSDREPQLQLHLKTMDFSGESQPVFSTAFSSNGQYVAVGTGDGVARVWDLSKMKQLAALEGQISGVASLCFSADDRTLASCSHSGRMKFWHVPTWRELMSVRAETDNLYFSSDGSYFAAIVRDCDPEDFPGEGPGLRIWKAPTLAEIDANHSPQPQQ